MGNRPSVANRLSLVLIDRSRGCEMTRWDDEAHETSTTAGSVTVEATRRAARRLRSQQGKGKTSPDQVSLHTAAEPRPREARADAGTETID